MSAQNGTDFSGGLTGIVGVAGAMMGGSIGADDPGIGVFPGLLTGLLMGAVGGRILAFFVTLAIQILIAVVGVAIIGFRVISFLNLVGS